MAAFEGKCTDPLDVRNSLGARLAAGLVIDDRYEIIEFVGAGGMCDVYTARHTQLNKTIALKFLQRRRLSDEKAMERFRREAVFISNLEHPNIVKVFGFGMWERQLYLAMEYVQGASLADLLKNETRLGRTRALHIFDQILQALEHAHERGIVHRDLKPSNVMLLEEDVVKLVDFGIAKMLPESGKDIQKLTQTEDIFGTLLYISPEQCLGRPIDARSDIYSMGCLMYETLTGGPPLSADTPFALIHKQLTEPTPTSAWLDQSLSRPVMQCMEKDPEKRPQSASALRELLSKCAKQSPRQSAAAPADNAAAHANTRMPVRRKRILVPICIGASVALAFPVWRMYKESIAATTKPAALSTDTMHAGEDRCSYKIDQAGARQHNGDWAGAEKLYKEVLATRDFANAESRFNALVQLIAISANRGDSDSRVAYSKEYFEEVQQYAPNSVERQMEANSMMMRAAEIRGDSQERLRWANKQFDLLTAHPQSGNHSENEQLHLAEAFYAKAQVKEQEGDLKVAYANYLGSIGQIVPSGLSNYGQMRYLAANDELIDFLLRHQRTEEARGRIKLLQRFRTSWRQREPGSYYRWAVQYREIKDHSMALKAINEAIKCASEMKMNSTLRTRLFEFRAEEYVYAGDMVSAYQDRAEAQAITSGSRTQ